jgi:hypothetical protein
LEYGDDLTLVDRSTSERLLETVRPRMWRPVPRLKVSAARAKNSRLQQAATLEPQPWDPTDTSFLAIEYAAAQVEAT